MVPTSSAPDQFQVHLLGTFRVVYKTRSIHLPTRKTEALLAYLILHPCTHTREKLAALFWGDSSDTAARGSLRKALTLLRKHIDDEIVLADRENIQLNSSFSIWVDIHNIENLAHELLRDPSHDIHRFNEIIYPGDLLSNLYDDWIFPLRTHYRTLYLDVMLRAIEQARAQSEYKLAIEYAQNILAIDIANERAYQHLMFCHMTLGDRNKALGQYYACQRALQTELAVEPSQETRALYEWIKDTASDISSMAARVTNLPIPISSFVGRNRELSKIKHLLSNTRLVTLTGVGGSGKTRLAIHTATDLIDSFRDGVWWVELAPLTEPSLIPSTVAKALGIDGRSDQPLTETLKQYLRNKKLLLVLDNCEHLIDACAHLAESLLTSCADLKILATSREALSLTGENVWPVPPLSLPEGQITLLDLLMQYEGVRLFAERARAVNPEFTPDDENAVAVTQICQRLDGIPLAIELVAARIRNMSVEQISAGLDDRFQLLTASTRTANLRHQTLHAAIDWSYNLLSETERQLFCRLSVFAGGWTLEAAEAVCSGEGLEKEEILDLLAQLAGKSLVNISTDGQRYNMLETMRQYGDEKLIQDGEKDRIFQRYLDYYLEMSEIGDVKIRGFEQMAWLNWFKKERDNLSSAMDAALGSSEALEKGCELVCSLCWYWKMVGDYTIMRAWLETSLSRSSALVCMPTKARLLLNAGLYSAAGVDLLELNEIQSMLEESLEMWDELGSEFNLQSAKCLLMMGWIQKHLLQNDKSYDYFDQAIAIFKEEGDLWWHAWSLNLKVCRMVEDSCDVQLIQTILKEETALWEKTGDQCTSAVVLWDLGFLACKRGDLLEAQRFFQESLLRYRKFGAKSYLLQTLIHLGDIARGLKQYDLAETYYKECMPLVDYVVWTDWLSRIYQGMGYVALSKGESQSAQEYFQQALKISLEFNLAYDQNLCIADHAALAVVRGETLLAVRLFGAFFTLMKREQYKTSQKIIDAVDQIEIEAYLAHCKTQIGQAEFEQAWCEGSSLSIDDVISEILRGSV